MANYDWREFRGRPWWRRYPDSLPGYRLWSALVDPENTRRDTREVRSLDAALRELAEARHAPDLTRGGEDEPPCVFISHRQADVAEAERIAWIACQEGFDFWLDVYDPTLVSYSGVTVPTAEEAKIIALTIEMALLHATHVIAVMTPQTAGSTWVPYEYGRVKDPVPESPQAACWLCPTVTSFPEYLHLGRLLKSEAAIRAWLKGERRRLGIETDIDCRWGRKIPAELG